MQRSSLHTSNPRCVGHPCVQGVGCIAAGGWSSKHTATSPSVLGRGGMVWQLIARITCTNLRLVSEYQSGNSACRALLLCTLFL